MGQMTRSVLVFGLVMAAFAATAAVQAEEAAGPSENITVSSVSVTWQYSNDGGKTFADKPLPAPPPGSEPGRGGKTYPYAWRGTFEIADAAKVAGLWVRITGEGDNPRSTICNGDLIAASGGYWKDLGFCPTLLDAVVSLNGKEVPIAYGPILQFWVPLIGEIKTGKNNIELSGHVYTYWGGASWAGTQGPVNALDARIVAAEAQPAEIYNGPVLGDFGDGYFTLACRTRLPADLTVVATPVDPAGPAVKILSTGKIWHRVKIEVPKGTRKISYSLSAAVGPHVTKRGPYTLTLPGKEYRFVAFGNAAQHPVNEIDPWAANAKCVLKAQPDFVVNTGNLMEQETWSFNMEKAYTGPAAELLARVPTLVTPCNRDFAGIFNELHYTPAPDTYMHNWTKVVGQALFIGIDGNHDWSAGGQDAKWLEEVLAASREKFIIVLCGYPGYSSGINSKKMYGGRVNSRNVIMPLLGKYKATMMLSSWDPDYERIEPTADKGVTQIVTGAVGRACWHKWDGRLGSHPFGPPNGDARGTVGKVALPDGREWVGYFSRRHFCVFDVKGDAIEMKVLASPWPKHEAEIKDLEVLDQKTFKPRQ